MSTPATNFPIAAPIINSSGIPRTSMRDDYSLLFCSSSSSDCESPPSSTHESLRHDHSRISVASMLHQINNRKGSDFSMSAKSKAGLLINGFPTHSGKRRPGQGCEDVAQAIMLAEPTKTGGARLRITLLVSGFIIGPRGSSVRDVSSISGADVRSKTINKDAVCSRDCREFSVEGRASSVNHALSVLCDAVERYKQLTEGEYAGRTVGHVQRVGGVEFFYHPPPRNRMPQAASLQGNMRVKHHTYANAARLPRADRASSMQRISNDSRTSEPEAPSVVVAYASRVGLPSPTPAGNGTASPAMPEMSRAEMLSSLLGRGTTDGNSTTTTQQQPETPPPITTATFNNTTYMLTQPGNVLVPISLVMPPDGSFGTPVTPTAAMLQQQQQPPALRPMGLPQYADQYGFNAADAVLAHLTRSLQTAVSLQTQGQPQEQAEYQPAAGRAASADIPSVWSQRSLNNANNAANNSASISIAGDVNSPSNNISAYGSEYSTTGSLFSGPGLDLGLGEALSPGSAMSLNSPLMGMLNNNTSDSASDFTPYTSPGLSRAGSSWTDAGSQRTSIDLLGHSSLDLNVLASTPEESESEREAEVAAEAAAWSAVQAALQATPWSGGPWSAFEGFETPLSPPPPAPMAVLEEEGVEEQYNFLGQSIWFLE